PDTIETLRTAAPRSVLLFGRPVSTPDFAVLAALAPGVTRAQSEFGWIESEQQAGGIVSYIGTTTEPDLKKFFADQAEPNIPLQVNKATADPFTLKLVVGVDPAFDPKPVEQAIRFALTNPKTGPLAFENAVIGGQFWISKIYDAVQSVAGVVAVQRATRVRR